MENVSHVFSAVARFLDSCHHRYNLCYHGHGYTDPGLSGVSTLVAPGSLSILSKVMF